MTRHPQFRIPLPSLLVPRLVGAGRRLAVLGLVLIPSSVAACAAQSDDEGFGTPGAASAMGAGPDGGVVHAAGADAAHDSAADTSTPADAARTDAPVGDGSEAREASTDAEAGRAVDRMDGGDGIPVAEPGDLLITEVMFDPSDEDPASEWFEVYNVAASARALGGLTLRDGHGAEHVIASSPVVVAPAGQYVLVVRDSQGAADDGLPASSIVYAYGDGLSPDEGVRLTNDGSGSVSLSDGATLLVSVPYGQWQPSVEGATYELGGLDPASSDQPGSWCVAFSPWALGSDDGTPGAASDCF